MFIKRAKSRPSLRARESDVEPAPSPLGKSSITADDVGSSLAAGASSSLSNGAASGSAAYNGGVAAEEDDAEAGSVMERKKAQKGKKDKRLGGVKSGGPRLSFGGAGEEGDGDAFATGGGGGGRTKSRLSQAHLPTSSTAPADAPSPAGSSSYSREYLSELKAATPTRAPRVDVEDVAERGGELSSIARQKYASQFAEDTTAGIPDAAAVAAARMKRQAAVENAKHAGQLGEEEDYIALGGGKVIVRDAGAGDGPHPESRLMREDDEGDEGDEDLADYTESKDRLYIGKQANKDAARRLRGEMNEMIADREGEEQSDEETREWELAQARRAGGGRDHDVPEVKVHTGFVPAQIPRIRPPPSIAPAQARILAAMAQARSVKETGEHDMDVVSQELAALEIQEKDLRLEVERVEGKREWIEEFRGWVEMLGLFLEEKLPLLDAIEKDALGHLRERFELVEKRRMADDLDDLALVLGVAPPEDANGNGNVDVDEEETDELGRTRRRENAAGPSSGVRRARREERGARRARRKARPASAQALGPAGDDEGFSTDSTLVDGDVRDYASAQHDLSKRVDALLDDVKAEDFREPDKGLAVRFGDWRRRYEDEYVGAFGGLSLVQAWSFWARGEMVGWEPLRSGSAIEEFTWYKSLHAYSRPRPQAANPDADMDMDDDDEPPLGPDGDLNTQMTNDAVVPLLIASFANGAYDPYSAKQTRKAVDLLEVVQDLAGKDSRKFNDLLRALVSVFSTHITSLSLAISSTLLPTSLPAPTFDPATRGAAQRFVRRRVKLLRNLLLCRRLAPNEVRECIGRVVRELVRPVLARQWDGAGREMAGQVLMASGGLLAGDVVAFLQHGPR